MHAVLEALQHSPLSQAITGERWPAALAGKQILETLHMLGFELQIGAVMVLSMRLLGVGRSMPIAAVARPVFWAAWPGFVVVLVTGALQFLPIATEVFYRPSFRAKMALLVIALISLVWLHARVRRGAVAWDAGVTVPAAVKALAVCSLVSWPAVIVVARLMYAFVQMSTP